MPIDIITDPYDLRHHEAVLLQDVASEAQVHSFMLEHSSDFNPPFAENLDLMAYAHKVRTHARTFEIWKGEKLTALMALYLDASSGQVYITYICTARSGLNVRGLGSILMNEAKRLPLPYNHIRLEVLKTNTIAMQFYIKHGFAPCEDRGTKLLMECPFLHDCAN